MIQASFIILGVLVICSFICVAIRFQRRIDERNEPKRIIMSGRPDSTTLIAKRINLSWEEGDDKGGLASSLSMEPNTAYYYFLLIKNNGVLDGGFDTHETAKNLLKDAVGYSIIKRSGCFVTDKAAEIIEVTIR